MKFLDTLIEELKELQAQGYGKCVIIYSADEEGNDFKKLHYSPSTAIVKNLKDYSLELLDGGIPNAIIIN